MKEVKKENTPPCQIPYRDVHHPYRFQFVIPGNGIEVLEDANGVLFLSAKGGSLDNLVSGENISIDRTEDGKVIISAVDTITDVAAGQNVTITIDPDTGAAVINAITGGATNEHYKGVFDTAQDLIDYDTDPEVGDYGLIKHVEYSDGGETTWNGQYKYCFYINGSWTVVDQMLTFTKNLDLLQQFYSVGGSSPVIYLHEVARSGDFRDLNNVPIVATPEVTVEGTTVTASCATEGAEIWYTTDGSMPHVNGTKYNGPITVSGATTFRFVGIKNGMINSLEAVVGADYSLQAPSVDLDWHDGTVTMTNPNQSGDIYYTLDGTVPTDQSTLYTGPFVVTDTSRFRIVVVDSMNGISSPITDKRYDKLVFDHRSVGGNSVIGTAVYGISTSPVLGEVHYTENGPDPDWLSPVLSSPLSFSYYGSVRVFKTIGFAPDYVPTNIDSYSVGAVKPVTPPIYFNASNNTVSLVDSETVTQSGTRYGYISGLYGQVILSSSSGNTHSKIYYTLDGSTPTDQSTRYTGPFQISGNTTVKAVIVAYGQYSSDVATENIVITAEPSISMNYLNGEIAIEGPAGASVYYTLDGSDPTSESTLYTGPIADIPQLFSREIKAVAIVNGQASGITSEIYTRAITGNPAYSVSRNYSIGTVSVSAPSAPAASELYYAVASPDADVRSLTYAAYTSPVSIDYYSLSNPRTVVIKTASRGYLPADSFPEGLGYTAPTAPEITYDDGTNLVTIELAGNTAYIPLQTNNNVPTMGARIYYTTDGSTPTTSSTLYTRPFNLPEGATVIKAITVCYGEWESEVTTVDLSPVSETDYLYFEAVEANSTVLMISSLTTAPQLEYSTDGVNFQEWQYTTTTEEDMTIHVFDTLTLGAVGDKVYLRGVNTAMCDGENRSSFTMSGSISAGGSITSLLDGDGVSMTSAPDFAFPFLFVDALRVQNTALVNAPSLGNLISAGDYAFVLTFGFCVSIQDAADMSKFETLGDYCCGSSEDLGMYMECHSLVRAADMGNVSSFGSDACLAMYKLCDSLVLIQSGELTFDFPALPITAGDSTFSTPEEIEEWMKPTI